MFINLLLYLNNDVNKKSQDYLKTYFSYKIYN
jgi:hypothetical protein